MSNKKDSEIPQTITWDVSTGEQTVRDLTQQEIAELELARVEFENQSKAKEKARESALAKLAKLGLTEEEIASL
jgi:hypothetical protein